MNQSLHTPKEQTQKRNNAVKQLLIALIFLAALCIIVLLTQLKTRMSISRTLIDLLSKTVDGLSLGSIYAIIALGYSMVYGIAKMLNFAHGDVIMIGAYVSYISMERVGIPTIFAILISMAVCSLLGMVIEKLAYSPLRSAPSLAVLITAIGISILLQNTALLIFGTEPVSYQSVVPFGAVRLWGGDLIIKGEAIVCIAACIAVMVFLTLFTEKTKMGKAMRAVSEDREAAELMGINVNTTIAITFAIGSALAAIAGVLFCSKTPILSATTGSVPGIKAFTAAVLGGIGSIPGTFVGGLILGVIEIFGRAYISQELADAIVFAVLIIILLVRPTGLLGKKVTEKV